MVIAIVGLVFGRDAAQGAVLGQLTGLMGQQAAEVLQATLTSASGKSSGLIASIITARNASGLFGESADCAQSHLESRGMLSRLVRVPVTAAIGRPPETSRTGA